MRGAHCSALRRGLCYLPPFQAPVTRTHLHCASRKREKFFPLIPVARRRLDRSPGTATASPDPPARRVLPDCRDLPAASAQLVRKVRRVLLDRRALSAQRVRPETRASKDRRVRQERKDRRDSRGLREFRVYKDRRDFRVITDSSRSCWPAATWAAPCRRWTRMRGF